MKIISTRLKSFIDYATGILMILIPFFTLNGVFSLSTYLVIGAGIFTLIQSIITDYEGGIISRISMKKHNKIDAVTGLILLTIPLLLGVEYFMLPTVFGSVKIIACLLSREIPSYKGYQGYNYKKFTESYKGFEKFPSMKF